MTITLQELKNDAVRSEIKLSELLRRAKLILKDTDQKEFKDWLNKESNGYDKGEKVPEYRMIHGEPKGWNPYRGWIPFVIDNPKNQELISTRGSSQSIAELESLIENNKTFVCFKTPYPADTQAEFSKLVGLDTKFSLFISPSTIYGILNTVRNKFIDYLIETDTGQETVSTDKSKEKVIFPSELIEKLPKDLKILVDDFNFNFASGRPITGMLVLRRILPLSIVRKFQMLNREAEIKGGEGDYLETKLLLGKIKSLLSNKRIYSEMMSYKILIDSSQHSYTLNIQMSDTEGVAIKVRVFLDDIF